VHVFEMPRQVGHAVVLAATQPTLVHTAVQLRLEIVWTVLYY
jgi:hypothetical protein